MKFLFYRIHDLLFSVKNLLCFVSKLWIGMRIIKTTHLLIAQLEMRSKQIKSMNLSAAMNDEPLTGKLLNLANTPSDLDRSANAIEHLVNNAGLQFNEAKDVVKSLVTERSFYGSYCELGAYDWLNRNSAVFSAQIQLSGADVLNSNGCTIDGKFNVIDAYFDIKGMGFQSYAADQLKELLEQKLDGLEVVINGSMDVAVKNIERYAFDQLASLFSVVKNNGKVDIPELGWKIEARPRPKISISEQTIDPYKLAEENRYYPFKTARQFTRKAPFILIFSYAAQFNHSLFLNFSGHTDITLRSMARRAFFQIASDKLPVSDFDGKVQGGETVGEASKLISGLLFINLDNDDSYFFTNPRATHVLTKYHLEQIFDFQFPYEMNYDNFEYDNY